jgi:hypothetical protein
MLEIFRTKNRLQISGLAGGYPPIMLWQMVARATKTLGIALLSLFMMTTTVALAGWEPLPPLPEPNGGFVCGALGGKIVVIGGTNWKDNTKHWLDVIWVFDPTARQWKPQGKLPQPLAYPVLGEWNGDLVIGGGTDGTQSRKEIWRLSPSWEISQIGALREDRALPVGGVFGDQLIAIGGSADYAKFEALHRNGERIHLPDGKVSTLSIPDGSVFGLAASVVLGQELFVFGGAKYDAINQVADLSAVWAFDIPKATWRKLRPYPFPVRGASAVKLDQHHIFIAGGYGGEPAGFTAATYIYDPQHDTYTKSLDLPVAALVGLVSAGDFVYCLGGEDKMKHRTDVCARISVRELLGATK